MASRCMYNLATFAAVSGFACSLAPASVTIYGGPTWDRTTDTGYWLPHIYTNPGASAGNGTAIGCAEKRSGGAVIGWVAVRWDASGNAAWWQ